MNPATKSLFFIEKSSMTISTRYSTIISIEKLQADTKADADVVVFDCSFDLADPSSGLRQFEANHIPGARFADLDLHLSEKREGSTRESGGRHPLPTRERFAQWLGSQGVGPDTQVVVYDRQTQQYCGRLWWMCQWVGHHHCAVLDGGLAAWQNAGAAVESGPASDLDANLMKNHPLVTGFIEFVAIDSVVKSLGSGRQTIIDARAAPRYRGEVEPLDPIAGHIPGALNRPFASNFTADGLFKPAQTLRSEFKALLGERDPATVVHHCGSGVTATPNVLAMLIAGLGPTHLFAGSWSEWSNTPGLPVARG